MTIALIPARGGSKRIPRKNIRPFAGRPIIAYPIDAAKSCGLFEEIIVSTDDEEIAAVARDLGASAPFFRPAELADDHTGTADVVAHAAQWLLDHGRSFQSLCCIYPTAPFVGGDDLVSGNSRLADGDVDYVFSAGRFSYPVHRSFVLTTREGTIDPLFPEHRMTRSQDLPAVFHDAGQFYWGRTKAWLEKQAIFGARSGIVELPPWRVQDIDTEEDWRMAEMMFERLRHGQNASQAANVPSSIQGAHAAS